MTTAMISLESATTVGLVLIVGAGAGFDLRDRRVPNGLTVTGLTLALALGVLGGWAGLGAALAGAVIALVVALPVFLAGGLGGGDVKLLVATGAFLGPEELPAALVTIAVVGGIMAGVEVVRRGAVRRTLANLGHIVAGLGQGTFSRWRDRGSREALTIDAAGAVTVPYAVAIAVGAVLTRIAL